MCLRIARFRPGWFSNRTSGRIRWKTSRAPGSSPDRNRPDDLHEELGEAEPGHRAHGTAAELLEQHARARDRRAIRTPGAAARSRPTLGGLGSSSSLTTRHVGARSAMVASSSTRHVDAAAGGVVLHDDRQGDRLGDREVMGQDRRVVGSGERRWGEHDRVGAHGRGLARERDGPVGRGVADPDAHRQVAGDRDHAIDDRPPLVVRELAGLAEHAQDRHAVDAAAGHERGQAAAGSRRRAPVGANGVGTMFQTPWRRSIRAGRSAVRGFAGHVVGRPRQDDRARGPRATAPGSLVSTWSGSVNWKAPTINRRTTLMPRPIQPTTVSSR